MLPAIWFILSRMGCDQAALSAGLEVNLTTPEEREVIEQELRDLRWGAPRTCCEARARRQGAFASLALCSDR